jgi:hypothetical protein
MRIHVPCTALGLAAAAFAPAAHAETIVTRQIVSQPVETVRTVTTTRTIRRAPRSRVVVTRRTTISERPVYDVAVPAPAPVYDVAPPAPVVTTYPRPIYDVAAPVEDDTVVGPAPPLVDQALVSGAPVPVGTIVPAYRYVYQPDRILVIDPVSGIAVQSLPR